MTKCPYDFLSCNLQLSWELGYFCRYVKAGNCPPCQLSQSSGPPGPDAGPRRRGGPLSMQHLETPRDRRGGTEVGLGGPVTKSEEDKK